MKRVVASCLVLFGLLGAVYPSAAQEKKGPAENPLRPFERLMGGQWHTEGSFQEFEWGLGRRSIKARNYFWVDGEPKLVGEGLIFWDPRAQEIRGVFTAVDMPVVFFHAVSRFEGDDLHNDLLAYDASGQESAYREVFRFVDDSTMEWNLFQVEGGDETHMMSGTYTLKPKN